MTAHYPIVFETEDNGAVSAYVAGLPIYAQADGEAEAERAIQAMLTHYFAAHPPAPQTPWVKVAEVDASRRFNKYGRLLRRSSVEIVGAAALVGAQTNAKKAVASRANGLLGGRPRKAER